MRLNSIRLGPDSGTGGGGATTETPGAGTAPGLDPALLNKLFPEDAPRTTPPAGAGAGETTNLLKLEAGADEAAAAEQQRLQELAEASGKTVEEIQAEEQAAAEAEATEQARLQELAEASGKTVEEIQAEESAAAGKTAADIESKNLMKRVSGLLSRLDKAERENEELRASRGQGGPVVPDEVGRITKAADLQSLQERTETGLEQTETYLAQLQYDHEGVADELRKIAANNPTLAARFKKPGENGEVVDDYTPGKMARVLNEIKTSLKGTLKAIPQRAQFINHRTRVTQLVRQPEITKVAPFITDVDSEEHETFRQLAQAGAGFVNGELLAAAAVIGLRSLNPVLKAMAEKALGKAPAKPGIAAPGKSRMPGTMTPAAAKANGNKFQSAKAAFLKKPGKAALEAVLEAV